MNSPRASTNRKARAAIYRDAAKIVEGKENLGGSYSCHAIAEAMGVFPRAVSNELPEVSAYADVFAKDARANGKYHNAWMQNASENYDYAEIGSCRVLALCFMAAMVERP